MIEKMYSIKSSSIETGISIAMIKKLIANKELSVVKVGNKNFIKESTLINYLNTRTIEGEI